jgi:3-hydroxyacyl-CoA dehydrogenase
VAVKRSPGVVVLRSFKDRGGVVKKTGSASLVDVGDGVLVLEFHSKMNTLDTDVGEAAEKAFELMEAGHAGLVVSNEDPRIFTAGANLMLVMMCIGQKDWKGLEGLARGLQGLNMKFKYCKKPVVSAPFGMCFGGGMEISLHCDAVQAHAELNMGLVETGVGIVPAGGGAKELALRMVAPAQEAFPGRLLEGLGHAFECIATARFSASAREAFNLGYLRPGVDGITMNREHLISDAKKRVLELAKGYIPPKPGTVKLPGEPGRVVIEQAAREMQRWGMISEYDVVIASWVARILTGGDIPAFSEVTEQQLLDLEIEGFLAVCGEQKTMDRISHTLTTGKQLKN